ncbi:MAG: hypothetical protein V4617_01050 [Gemmatimonadota bacterium]
MAAVDAASGRITAVAIGTAFVHAEYRTSGSITPGTRDSLRVTVR